MKVLMTINSLAKRIVGNFTLFSFYRYLQEIDFFSWRFIGKYKVGVAFVNIFQKVINTFLCVCPNEKKYIIDECFPKPRFYLLKF